jgi:hypothetical protein
MVTSYIGGRAIGQPLPRAGAREDLGSWNSTTLSTIRLQTAPHFAYTNTAMTKRIYLQLQLQNAVR